MHLQIFGECLPFFNYLFRREKEKQILTASATEEHFYFRRKLLRQGTGVSVQSKREYSVRQCNLRTYGKYLQAQILQTL